MDGRILPMTLGHQSHNCPTAKHYTDFSCDSQNAKAEIKYLSNVETFHKMLTSGDSD
jgi:hypothetical protein